MKLTIDQLAESIGVETPSDFLEKNECYLYAYDYAWKYAKDQGKTEEECEAIGSEEGEREEERVYKAYCNAVEKAASRLYGNHNLMLVEGKNHTYTIKPKVSWKDAAAQVIETINGVGYFHFNGVGEFLRSGPYTPKEAVTSHLHWIKRYADVYGDTSAKYEIQRSMRYV
jgi:hypothetical protein